jgi:hypothetical protein
VLFKLINTQDMLLIQPFHLKGEPATLGVAPDSGFQENSKEIGKRKA